MHFHYIFSAASILWTLTFAADLVLLVVLLGRDRARRFPWFTASITVMTLLLLMTKLLTNRIAPVTASILFLSISCVATAINLLVPVEIARRAFAGASGRAWAIGTIVVLAIAVGVTVLWGPWPGWNTFASRSLMSALRAMQMFADKGSVLSAFLDIEVMVAIVLLGRRFHAGWRSHAQMIAIGLSAASLGQLAVRLTWQLIATHTTVHSRAQYDRLMALRERLFHASNMVFLFALVWWIAWLWLDEPGTPATSEMGEAAGHATLSQS